MRSWSTILSGDIAEDAWSAVNAIAGAIWTRSYLQPAQESTVRSRYEDTLLYAYLALAKNDAMWADRAIERLNESIDAAPALGRHLGLHGGLSGLGWVIKHLVDLLGAPSNDTSSTSEDNELTADIDSAIIRDLQCVAWRGQYDLISGLVGYGIYFLERLPCDSAVRGITAVMTHLGKLSETANKGITWHSGPDLLPHWQRAICPDGYYNMGVAHGIPGILHFLSEVAALGLDDRAGDLLGASMEWFVSHRRPAGSMSWFSSWIASGTPTDSRLAWCYGDLGILSVLHQISRRSRQGDWRAFSNELLEHCLAWPLERAGINDAPLCHGAIGVAHVFNRIYQEDGDERCRESAISWYKRALTMRRPGSGIGGFSAFTRPDPNGPVVWEATPAFLDGAVGVALGLIAALTSVEPQWDRMLLISGRPQTLAR